MKTISIDLITVILWKPLRKHICEVKPNHIKVYRILGALIIENQFLGRQSSTLLEIPRAKRILQPLSMVYLVF